MVPDETFTASVLNIVKSIRLRNTKLGRWVADVILMPLIDLKRALQESSPVSKGPEIDALLGLVINECYKAHQSFISVGNPPCGALQL